MGYLVIYMDAKKKKKKRIMGDPVIYIYIYRINYLLQFKLKSNYLLEFQIKAAPYLKYNLKATI